MLAVCFSPDGRHVAVGGEDDLIALYSMEEGVVVAWGEGHASWVSALAFDPWCGNLGTGRVWFLLKFRIRL